MESDFHMWASFAIIIAAMVLYAVERYAMEITSLMVLVALLLLFTLLPYRDMAGDILLTPTMLLAGFGNPALITIMALLVLAQGLFQSGALEKLIESLSSRAARTPMLALVSVLIGATISSALLNNTPVVLMTIPILTAIAARARTNASPYLMCLSYMTILGGMLTLIGSSTNLLVADTAEQLGTVRIEFFDLTLPGLVLLGVGALYVIFVMPRLLTIRDGEVEQDRPDKGRQYIVELRLRAGDTLVGTHTQAGFLPALSGMTVQMIERGTSKMLPPFDDIELQPGDKIFIAATRRELSDALANRDHPLQSQILPLVPDSDNDSETMLAELVVAPGSRMAGRAVYQTGFSHTTDCFILGVQRRSRMLRHELADMRLEAGDVLLVIGGQKNIANLRHNRDTLLLEWSASELPNFENANLARLIFAGTVLAAASGLVPIVVAAMAGAGLMVVTGILNTRQAVRGFDTRIFLVVASALAMAKALTVTGGAAYVTDGFLTLFAASSPAIILSAFFLICAIITNILSNNATAVLFTPLAVSLARSLGVDPMAFILAVIFAANCSFATPIAYQTNLLVMTPGNFRFADFMRAGIPLIVLLWISYSLFAPIYFNL
ncbi:MAG: SLC13 family permease [Parvibaculales bacterium]